MKTATPKKGQTIEQLTTELTQVKQELAECLEANPAVGHNENMHRLLIPIVRGVFMPVPVWIQQGETGSGKGQWVYHHKNWLWNALLDMLLLHDKFTSYWSHKSFREVVVIVISIMRDLHHARLTYKDNEGTFDYTYSFHGYSKEYFECIATVNDSEHKGTIMLKAAVLEMYSIPDIENVHGIDREDIDQLLISLTIIIDCQKFWLQSQAEEVENEKEEETE